MQNEHKNGTIKDFLLSSYYYILRHSSNLFQLLLTDIIFISSLILKKVKEWVCFPANIIGF